ncbi:peptidoglycan DD-metalloendopeptidase family protein [Allomuricauda sp. SCSIO 65647]|uniref:peptidoglycan DD-metalloendopeptidase family protein n=1 Tax=Allomuricauda sp. SCSIO 65647 TaxID=2908843 RepID=UPI001F1A44DD|nr:peptidoglycan DD-metalloendopeptidase family protein [Muricauda sp. SCSIO 65647]UJH66854.1 peptidoglycan DD-metalloendopeptidase family protein [Muricauda sp. SCSIO 65647]
MPSNDSLFHDISHAEAPILPLDWAIPFKAYCSLDLSIENKELNGIVISDPLACQRYIDSVLEKNGAQVAYGGYLEKRALYADSDRFSEGGARNIHLGVDFWCKAGTNVIAPLNATVHSFKNNSDKGNYGPTIILEHKSPVGAMFYTLYGHLSVQSLDGLYRGKPVKRGDVLAGLGTPDINVNYAPHLHFQLIVDLQGYNGDYPGVCSQEHVEFYRNNCPDPNLLLGFPE